MEHSHSRVQTLIRKQPQTSLIISIKRANKHKPMITFSGASRKLSFSCNFLKLLMVSERHLELIKKCNLSGRMENLGKMSPKQQMSQRVRISAFLQTSFNIKWKIQLWTLTPNFPIYTCCTTPEPEGDFEDSDEVRCAIKFMYNITIKGKAADVVR